MCGIIGIADHQHAAQKAYLGLFALQHRGQEAAGIIAADRGRLAGRTALGLVAEAFPDRVLREIRGRAAVAHVRYATAGGSDLVNAQPLLFETVHGPIAIAHNGTLTNALHLRRKLESQGAIFRTSADSEVIVHLIARLPGPIEGAIAGALKQIDGAYSLIFLTPGKLIAVRDPRGFRPLCVGRLGRAPVFASETNAIHQMGARFVREVEPGELVVVQDGGRGSAAVLRRLGMGVRRTGGRLRSLKPFGPLPAPTQCVFEEIYFARPDSRVFGLSVQATRRALGRELAREMAPVKADVVVPVPDSGVPAALGFSRESGVDFEMGIVRSHYIGRTFIQPAQVLRDNSVNLKLSPIPEALRGKRIILIDDSIVRGTTSRRICRMLRRAGVAEIHMAICSPPIVSSCYYGIDTPRREELIAARGPVEATRRFIGVDSLTYLSTEGLLRAVGSRDFCLACFTGRYPTRIMDFEAALPSRVKTARPAAAKSPMGVA